MTNYNCNLVSGVCKKGSCKNDKNCFPLSSNKISFDKCKTVCKEMAQHHILPGVPTPSGLIPGVPTPRRHRKKEKLGSGIIVIIILGSLAALILIILLFSQNNITRGS